MNSGSENRGLDLEKELTCSICTEVLYQPLTLLDCLHTFCGSCLKEWFSFQLLSVNNAQTPLPPGGTPYTCPSCRAPVRDTKHSSTIATLLDMFLARSPEKGRTAEEKEEVAAKYTVGDEVLPKWEQRERSSRERRLEDEDRRLVEEVRDMSLREVGVESSEARRERRRRERDGDRSHGSRHHSSRENSRDNRNTDDADRRRRREEHHERRRTRQGNAALRPEPEQSDSEGRRRERRKWKKRFFDRLGKKVYWMGLTLKNIDVSQEDQISERIAEAFRRRQAERLRPEPSRRIESDAADRRRRSPRVSPTDSGRETSSDDTPRTTRRRRNHASRSGSMSNEQSRPPPSISAVHVNHLEVGPSAGGRRRVRRQRTLSAPRSSTVPVPVIASEERPATRSQTDLSTRTATTDRLQHKVIKHTTAVASTSNSTPRTPSNSLVERSQSEDIPTAPVPLRTRVQAPEDIFVASAVPAAVPYMDESLVPAPLSPHTPTHLALDKAAALSSGSRPTSSHSVGSRPRTKALS
ncbi:hypothetical protein DID88_008206 [Monilinia fructigena]|uniref:RING-type domain-containing protein n=1 Tax=Monilinia fructigena TaxID=38457 RepID=A0A395J531_9HELO|nr:hypothetical protein DID88_008206 [Monilinia fructigena]